MPLKPSLTAIFACMILASGVAGAALAADGASQFEFLRQEGLKRQGLLPQPEQQPRPTTRSFQGPDLPKISATPSIPQSRTYCVRTCDGYYFAIGFARNKGQLAEQRTMCAASCGDAPMVLYSAPLTQETNNGSTAPAIERAIDDKGALYMALPTAYAFKNSDTNACACKSTASGLPQIPISIDPTLRNGDLVVTADGVKVFRGQKDGPHKNEDFVGLSDAKSLPAFVRQQMLSLQNRISE